MGRCGHIQGLPSSVVGTPRPRESLRGGEGRHYMEPTCPTVRQPRSRAWQTGAHAEFRASKPPATRRCRVLSAPGRPARMRTFPGPGRSLSDAPPLTSRKWLRLGIRKAAVLHAALPCTQSLAPRRFSSGEGTAPGRPLSAAESLGVQASLPQKEKGPRPHVYSDFPDQSLQETPMLH